MSDIRHDDELSDTELELAAKEGERAPAWLLTDDPVAPTGGMSEDGQAVMRELLRPIDPAGRARIVDQSVEALTAPPAGIPAATNVVALPGWRRRWLWGFVPLVAAAAGVVLVFSGGPEPADGGSLAGETLLRSAKRGEPSRPARELNLAAGENLYLDCKTRDGAHRVVAVQARRDADVRDIEFKTASDEGTTVHVLRPALQGVWAIHCGVSKSGGRILWIDPPAQLILD